MSCEILLCYYRTINLNVEAGVLCGKGLSLNMYIYIYINFILISLFFPPLSLPMERKKKSPHVKKISFNFPEMTEQLLFIPI